MINHAPEIIIALGWALMLIVLSGVPDTARATQLCLADSMPLPIGYPDQDDSGLRPSVEPPVSAGATIQWSCPGVKRWNNKYLWHMDCAADGSLHFNPLPKDWPKWPECQCDHDLSQSKCPKASYVSHYQDGTGNGASTTIKLALNETENVVTSFSLLLTMDTNVQALLVHSPNAQVNIKSGTVLEIVPSDSTDLTKDRVDITITYTHSNFNAQPKWKHPCIAQIECDISQDSTGSEKFWIIFGVATGVIVAAMCIGWALCFAAKSK